MYVCMYVCMYAMLYILAYRKRFEGNKTKQTKGKTNEWLMCEYIGYYIHASFFFFFAGIALAKKAPHGLSLSLFLSFSLSALFYN